MNSGLRKKLCSIRACTWRVTPRYIRLKAASPSRRGRAPSICSMTAMASSTVDAVVHGGGKAIAIGTTYSAECRSSQVIAGTL